MSAKTTIIRAPRSKDNPYFIVRRDTAQDARLSFEARGVMLYLLSKSDDWKLHPVDLMREGGCGRDKIRRILGELEAAGYLRREQERGEREKFGHNHYMLYEQPLTENPPTDKPSTENPQHTNKRINESTEETKKDDNNSAPVAASESPPETPQTEPTEQKPSRRSRLSDPDLGRVSKAFESEIGMITPFMADKLAAAVDDYPADWIVEAIGRAVEQNKRKWSYVNGILQNWRVEGKSEKPPNGKHAPTLSPPDPACPICEGRGLYTTPTANGNESHVCECRKATVAA